MPKKQKYSLFRISPVCAALLRKIALEKNWSLRTAADLAVYALVKSEKIK